jgi:diguanylate cyclase (GGDEF)-like protein
MSEDTKDRPRNLAKRTHEMLIGMSGKSKVDQDTGLLNKRGWTDKVSELERLAVRSGQPMIYLMLDLDELKIINDESEDHHTAGDALIRNTAEVLKGKVRETDVVARYGGDEFTVALPLTNLVDARIVVDRIVEGMQSAGIKFSIGMGNTILEADNEMYKMKKIHKNG